MSRDKLEKIMRDETVLRKLFLSDNRYVAMRVTRYVEYIFFISTE